MNNYTLALAALIFLAPQATSAHDIVQPSRQSVMIGPFPDGRIVWCRGRQDEAGNIVIAPDDAATCRMDTSDVKSVEPVEPRGVARICPDGSLPILGGRACQMGARPRK